MALVHIMVIDFERKEQELKDIIAKKDIETLRSFCDSFEPVDLAEIANQLQPLDLLFVFKTVTSEYTAEVFTYLDQQVQENLLNLFTDKQVMELIENTFSDDIADFLEDMPANLVSKVLDKADKATRNDINLLLNYKPETAGSILTREYIELKENLSVSDALDKIRKIGKDAITIHSTFVIDAKRNLVGVLYIEDLLFARPDEKIGDVCEKDFITVQVNDDQEHVASVFQRYDRNVIPVLNTDHKLVGVITVDDIIDVITDEVSEDIEKMAAVTPLEKSYRESSTLTLVKSSAPWILILMVLGVFSTLILNRFEENIASVIIMSTFIPLLLDTVGNSGTQSAALVTRSLTLKEYDKSEYGLIIWKELRIAFVVGIVVALFALVMINLEFIIGIVRLSEIDGVMLAKWSEGWWRETIKVSLTISLTLFVAITIAKVVGASLPIIAKLVKLDPALMANPLVTTIVDIVVLVLYFGFIAILF